MILGFLLGAVGWRVRGDDTGVLKNISLGTQRLFYAFCGALAIWFQTDNTLLSWAAVPALFLGTLPGYFGGEFGVNELANKNILNYARLTLRGMFTFIPLVIITFFFHYYDKLDAVYGLVSVVAGASFVPSYWLGTKIKLKLPLLKSYTEWGEFIYGGIVTMLAGVSCVLYNV